MKNDETKVFEVPLRVDPQDGEAPCSMPQVQKPEVAASKKAEIGNWVIYTISDPRDFAVRYVGFTSRPMKIRKSAHMSNARAGNNSPVYRWIRKLMASGLSPIFTVIESGIGDSWVEREMYWIAYYRSVDRRKMLNCSDGGEGTIGVKLTADQRDRISKSLSGRRLSDVARKNISLAKMGDKNPNYGKKPSDETLAKKRAVSLGRKISEETKAKLRASRLNISDETRMKLSLSRKNMSEENKQKIRNGIINMSPEAKARRFKGISIGLMVRCLNTGKEYRSFEAAARDVGISGKTVGRCARGGFSDRGGLRFEFIDTVDGGMNGQEEG